MAATPIATILADELAALREFVLLLQDEQVTLVAGNADHLTSLIDKKSALAARLTDCAQRREAALATAGFQSGRSGMDAWLATCPADAASRNNWRELLMLASEARSQNELNGKLIGTRLQHNQQALAALMGATERAMTYGPDGQTSVRPGGSGRILGSA
ncbi:MAG: flagellar protein FlgN [Gammaproteobacteria bacterium]|nr:flagellar protein FlgN [Gammaproteobacteria bacterium]MBU1646165.1 flagellar protein FlgN [Gammaproteobacteria bacterium]MBU1972227.1 flagellar protein FlgN [Gammaproteobacteria bacterium]